MFIHLHSLNQHLAFILGVLGIDLDATESDPVTVHVGVVEGVPLSFDDESELLKVQLRQVLPDVICLTLLLEGLEVLGIHAQKNISLLSHE